MASELAGLARRATTEPRVVAEPADFTHALDADPAARAAYDRLREHITE